MLMPIWTILTTLTPAIFQQESGILNNVEMRQCKYNIEQALCAILQNGLPFLNDHEICDDPVNKTKVLFKAFTDLHVPLDDRGDLRIQARQDKLNLLCYKDEWERTLTKDQSKECVMLMEEELVYIARYKYWNIFAHANYLVKAHKYCGQRPKSG
jgi:hypothetical protein